MFGKRKKEVNAAEAEDDKKELLRHIKLAIQTEKRGIKFYTEAKRIVDDYNMNKLMDVLLEQEHVHLKFFMNLYKAEKKKGENAAASTAGSYKKQPRIKNPLFRMRQMHELTKKKSTIYHLLRQAVEFEQEGHDLYMDIAKKVKNKKIKKFLKMVANEELKHKDFIRMHQDAVYNTGHWMGMEHVRLET